MNNRKMTTPFNETPKPGPLSLDGVFPEITTKASMEVEKEKEVSDKPHKCQLERIKKSDQLFRLVKTKKNGRNSLKIENWKWST